MGGIKSQWLLIPPIRLSSWILSARRHAHTVPDNEAVHLGIV